jgi:chromosomal replication initiation ATPase DnaA
VIGGLDEDVEETVFGEAEEYDLIEDEPPKDDEQHCRPSSKLSLEEIRIRVCEVYEISEKILKSRDRTQWIAEARGALGWMATELGAVSLTEVARSLGKDPSTMSVAARRFSERTRSSRDSRVRLQRLLGGIDVG